MKNKYILLVWEEVSTTRWNICKKMRRFIRDFFLFFASFVYMNSAQLRIKILHS